MKKLILFSCLLAFLFSCSSDDDGGSTTAIDSTNYLPNEEDDSWDYAYEYTNQGGYNSGNVHVAYNGTNHIEGVAYQVLDNTFPLIGSMDEVFLIKNSSNEVTLRPVFNLFDETADLGNLEFINNSMIEGGLVDEGTAEIVSDPMEIPANDNNISGTVTPKIYIHVKNYHEQKLDGMTINNNDYTQLIQQKLVYEIRVVLDIAIATLNGTVLTHELVENQAYGYTHVWLAKDKGIVQTNYDYSFEDIQMNTTMSFGGINVNLLELAPDLNFFNNALDLQGNSAIIE